MKTYLQISLYSSQNSDSRWHQKGLTRDQLNMLKGKECKFKSTTLLLKNKYSKLYKKIADKTLKFPFDVHTHNHVRPNKKVCVFPVTCPKKLG